MKLNEPLAKSLLLTAVIITVLSAVLFIYSSHEIKINGELDTDKFNHFGAFIAGTAGILISFAGTILIYVSITDQRKDIEQNREALSHQITELKNQREELELTREVFQQQSFTAELQRFENTFFNLLSLLNSNKQNISFTPISYSVLNNSQKLDYSGSEASLKYLTRARNEYINKLKTEKHPDSIETKITILLDSLQNAMFPHTSSFYNTCLAISLLIDEVKNYKTHMYVNIFKSQLNTIDKTIIAHHAIFDEDSTAIFRLGIIDDITPDDLIHQDFFSHYMNQKQASI